MEVSPAWIVRGCGTSAYYMPDAKPFLERAILEPTGPANVFPLVFVGPPVEGEGIPGIWNGPAAGYDESYVGSTSSEFLLPLFLGYPAGVVFGKSIEGAMLNPFCYMGDPSCVVFKRCG